MLKHVLTDYQALVQLGCTDLPLSRMLDSIEVSSGTASTYTQNHHKLILATIPEADTLSRNNHPWSTHTITELVAKHLPNSSSTKSTTIRLIVCGNDQDDHHPNILDYQGALVAAVAKAFPLYSRKTSNSSSSKS